MWFLIVPAAILLAVCLYFLIKRLALNKLRRYLNEIWGKDAALRRADDEQIDDIRRYYDAVSGTRRSQLLTDDITWNDLDMDQVFRAIDCSRSIVGSEVLYARLRNQGSSRHELDRLFKISDVFLRNPSLRCEAQVLLNGVGYQSFHGASRYLSGESNQYPRHRQLYYVLGMLPLFSVLIGLFYHPFFLAAAGLFLLNIVIYHITKAQWEKELTAIRHIASVLRCGAKLSALSDEAELQPEFDELRQLSEKLRSVKAWLPLFGVERVNDFDFITDYLKIAFMLDMVSLCEIVKALKRQGQYMNRLYELVGTIDVCLSLAQLQIREKGWSIPEFHESRSVIIKEVRHPLIRDAVLNDCAWDSNMLISGANASGKSTFIKAVAINLILAQTLDICFASSLSMHRGRVMSSMAIRDNVLAGESYFISEIKSLKRILDAAQIGGMIYGFIDEILRGTNTVERIAASASVLREIAGVRMLCMVATHDIELTVLMRQLFRNAHFEETVLQDGVHFDYLIKEGPATGRNAIRLLETMGFSADTIKRAQVMADEYDNTGVWRMP